MGRVRVIKEDESLLLIEKKYSWLSEVIPTVLLSRRTRWYLPSLVLAGLVLRGIIPLCGDLLQEGGFALILFVALLSIMLGIFFLGAVALERLIVSLVKNRTFCAWIEQSSL
ncbi:MAG: hypothetical protein ABH813_03305, partial [Patescibacteria group bacterium]